MNNFKFILCFILMLLLQLVFTKYCQIAPYFFICILPAMILSMPTSLSTTTVMLIAFACGFAVDILADGQLGLNAAALVPVAAMQKPLIRIFIGNDIVERGYSFSFWANGVFKIGIAAFVELVIYMTIYVLLDNLGNRDALFIILRIVCGVFVSLIFCLPAINILCPRPTR